MHSSRMRTAHLLAVSGGLPSEAGHPTPWYCGKADSPVNRMTDTCENITFLQLHLRAVKLSNQKDASVY